MTTPEHKTTTPTPTVSEAFFTAGDTAKLLGKSVTTIKTIAVQTNAPVTRTPGGLWILDAAAVEKIRSEIERREREAQR